MALLIRFLFEDWSSTLVLTSIFTFLIIVIKKKKTLHCLSIHVFIYDDFFVRQQLANACPFC